ncbi:AAA family ATPase [Mesorhizobium sp. B1-1-7]|uniref:AAA family ATPase n=1 Tax=Mesorhizobium sp. B1-1-7 TaxID=2589977 RepID=UPI00112D71C7|nr:AAA family ATPase [Mesorhizobium sp. B1-1-7]TPN42812.1 chromosome segregation protein SMC [Mesorhizobium sp. B1-1-7]
MVDSYLLESLTLSGFRAYLIPKRFDFRKKRSLAVFAPNGKGKSSIVDGLEFVFSDEGTLRRLGIRTINNNGGVTALAHNLASDRSIESFVEIDVRQGKTTLNGKRPATGAERGRPIIATALRSSFVVDPIIRGHELRHFVEKRSSEERYEDIARWLDLGWLVDVQQNLRELRRKVKATAENTASLKQVDTQLAKKTVNALTAWDDAAVIGYANTLVFALDAALSVRVLEAGDPAVASVGERADAEAKQVGLEGLRLIRRAVVRLVGETTNEGKDLDGLFEEFDGAVIRSNEALEQVEAEKAVAASSIFDEVWKSAESLFAEGAPVPDACPVCNTPIAQTNAGSVENIRAHISQHRAELAAYAAARKTADTASTELKAKHTQLITALKAPLALLPDTKAALKEDLRAYLSAVESWPGGPLPDSDALVASLLGYVDELDAAIDEILSKQGENSYTKVNFKITELMDLRNERLLAQRTLEELAKLSAALVEQSQSISAEIRTKVQAVLDTLQKPLNSIYAEIQRDAAAPIRLVLPAEEDANQQRLNLVVDFATNRTGVQPSGYLSDSQIHSLALSLRLAAIKRCNVVTPLIVLDDIVTSYDADHRLAFASLLVKQFADFQIILVTHDERFFIYLKDHLGDQNWQFTRILRLDPDGPRFSDQRVSDEMIEELWAEGRSAANDMRQAEEEWLLTICRDFGVDIRIRTVERAYAYERSELADALARFLGSRGITPPDVPGVNNRFLTSLQQGAVENFGSHFQDARYGDGSIGDEKVRWDEFKYFRGQFACPACGRMRFKRPNTINRPICASDKCETQFAFVAAVRSMDVA